MPMHVSLLLYISSNNAGKNTISKTFNILDSDPVRSRVEGSPAFSRYPGRTNFPYISLENSSNRFYAKHRLGSAETRRAIRLAGSLAFEGRITLLPGKTFCHAGIHFGPPNRINLAKCRFTEHERCNWERKLMEPKSGSGSNWRSCFACLLWWSRLLNAWRNIKVCVNSKLRLPAVNSVKRGNFFVIRTLGKVNSAWRVTLLPWTTFLHINRAMICINV